MHPEAVIAAIGFFTTVITAIVTLGPIGRALADRLRGKASLASLASVQDQLDEVLARLDDVQRQLGEMGERQDFAERVLAQERAKGALGPGA